MAARLEESLLEELKCCVVNESLYKRCSLQDIVGGVYSGHSVLQARLLRVREYDEGSRSWYVSTYSVTKQRQMNRSSGVFYRFMFFMCCMTGRIFGIKLSSRHEASCIMQCEDSLCVGGWCWLVDLTWINGARLGHRDSSIHLLSTSFPLLPVENLQDYMVPSSSLGYPLSISAVESNGSMRGFWISTPRITMNKCRYVLNTCPNVFCDRKVSLGYRGSATKTCCRVCTSFSASESRFCIELEVGGNWKQVSADIAAITTTVSGRKITSLFIHRDLLDASWEAYSAQIPNKLVALRQSTTSIVKLINDDDDSFWCILGWVMCGETKGSGGEDILINARKVHIVDLWANISDNIKESINANMVIGSAGGEE